MLALGLFWAWLTPVAAAPAPPEETIESSAPKKKDSKDDPQNISAAVATAQKIQALDKRFRDWLEEVDPLIRGRERAVFLSLESNYQRDAFIRRFWDARDPFPKTARNEWQERFERNVEEARAAYPSLQDDRARILLVHGEPAGSFKVKCGTERSPAEVWLYSGSFLVSQDFLLVFVRRGGVGTARIWEPGAIGTNSDLDLARRCVNGERLGQAISAIRQAGSEYYRILSRVLSKPRPRSEEWLSTFTSFTTDLPLGAETFEAGVNLEFLGRYQSRTVTQGLVRIPEGAAGVGEFAGYRSHDFRLTGEVVIGESLFENFRYRFGFPEGESRGHEIALAFQRYLRPGDYTLVLKLEDLNSGRFFRHEQPLSVPVVDEVFEAQVPVDPESAELFAEATAAVSSEVTSIRIVPPQRELLTGFVRFDTLALGRDLARVIFYLDDKQVLTKTRPPYNVELDLGPFPRLRRLAVEAQDEDGTVLARDDLLLNSGGNRFAVKLVEPQEGVDYESSLLAKAEVDLPEGRALDKLEIYLNEALVATLFQEPYVQPLTLPETQEISYVRAVAYLPDGNSTEDLVFINAPDNLDQVDVQFVELYASVLDKAGRPIQGLTVDDFRVEEDGVLQTVKRFDKVEDRPIHVGVLIDNSGSMRGSLGQARQAALSFFRQAITPKDRAAVITFNRIPTLAVKLTSDLPTLGAGLAGLAPEGETALYDSLMFGLYYFAGIRGQRAILLLSDGKDEASRFSYEETLEYARRAGVTVYSIGLNLRDFDARKKLTQIADETGGRSFYIRNISELEAIYSQIQQDLRSQYLLAYQSSNVTESDDFRFIEVIPSDRTLEVKTLSGYYP